MKGIEMTTVYNIAVAPNKSYVKYMYVLMESLFETNRDKKICFYILYNELDEKDCSRIEMFVKKNGAECRFIYIDKAVFANFPMEERFSVEAYFRLAVQDVIPTGVDKLLYLDCDMIVINDIEELYQENLEGKYFAACGFSPRCESGGDFNSGMLLFDMKRMREDITLDTYRILTQKMEKDFYLDQALLNEQFAKDGVKYVWKQKYNFTCPFYRKYKKQVQKELPDYSMEDIVIVHFAGPGIRPWQMRMGAKELKRLDQKNLLEVFAASGYLLDELYIGFLERWWKFAEKTPDYEQVLSDMQQKKNEIFTEVLMNVVCSKEYTMGHRLLRIPRKIKGLFG